jgi:hypothetical protein
MSKPYFCCWSAREAAAGGMLWCPQPTSRWTDLSLRCANQFGLTMCAEEKKWNDVHRKKQMIHGDLNKYGKKEIDRT